MTRRTAGEGSLFKLADGRWAADIAAGRGPFGRRKRVRVSGKSPSIVREKMLARQRELAEGALPVAKTTVASWLVAEWLPVVRARRRAATALGYERTVRKYIAPALGKIRFADLEPRDLEAWYASLKRKGVGPRAIAKAHAVLRTALGYAVRTGVTQRNPAAMVEPPEYRPKPRRRYTAVQVAAFLRALRGHPGEALFVAALFVQMRSGELLALRWSDLDLDARLIRVERTMTDDARGRAVVGETTKSRAGLRGIIMPRIVAEALARAPRAADHVFLSTRGKRPRRQGVSLWLRALCEQAGLPPITFHELRHTGASLLRELGADLVALRDRLGHESIETTADVYVHLDLSAQRQLSDLLDTAFGESFSHPVDNEASKSADAASAKATAAADVS